MATEPVSEDQDQFYGHGEKTWTRMREVTEELLLEDARGNCNSSYKRVNERLAAHGLPTFDLENEPIDRKAIGSLLGEISYATYHRNGVILSAICLKSDGKTVGGGFWKMLIDFRLVPEDILETETATAQTKRANARTKAVVLELLGRQAKDYYRAHR